MLFKGGTPTSQYTNKPQAAKPCKVTLARTDETRGVWEQHDLRGLCWIERIVINSAFTPKPFISSSISCSPPKYMAVQCRWPHLPAGIRLVVIVQGSTLSAQSYLPFLRRLPSNKGKHRQGRNLSPFCKSAKGAQLQLLISVPALCDLAKTKLLITKVLSTGCTAQLSASFQERIK